MVSATHRALSIPEIIFLIAECVELHPSRFISLSYRDGLSFAKADLLKGALVCRSFCEQFLDVLWRNTISLKALIPPESDGQAAQVCDFMAQRLLT
jgi:hypothetical protein